ncbi:MAG TPA: hypothetical protein VEB42_09180, partial [Chitinophagaceae bacterium]|nr:hypothetical protein [Chitinophagaceae bacterium]
MKKSTFTAIAAVAALVFLSLSFSKDNKGLMAPSGQRIAASMRALKAESVQIISGKHAGVREFEITDVSYLPVKKGYAAIITYRLQDGTTDSYGIFSGVELNLPQRAALSTDASYGKVKISCAGTCTCHLSTTINTDTGVITV